MHAECAQMLTPVLRISFADPAPGDVCVAGTRNLHGSPASALDSARMLTPVRRISIADPAPGDAFRCGDTESVWVARLRTVHTTVTDLHGMRISATVLGLRADISDGHFLGTR